MSEHTPWSYRPHEMDDWGIVKDARGWVVCQARDPELSDETLNAHRRAKTDPYEDRARLIAAAPDLLQLARDFEAWEARVIQHGDWSGECVRLTPNLHEEWLLLAEQRNAAIRKASSHD